MDFGFKKEESELIEEVREFIEQKITSELVEETHQLGAIYGGAEAREFIKKLGARGWLTPAWPRDYGGLDSSEMVTYIIRDEMAYAGLPLYFVAAYNAGPMILRDGSEEMKREFLPPIARGEIEFALGYTEPQAGSDLAALNIRAEDRGDHFLLNGQKMFNTSTHVADYHWLAARTNFDGPKHKGISLMVVDLKSPGITIRPLITMAGWRTNEVYYDDVVVPKKNMMGEKNRGFYYLMGALDFERMFAPSAYKRLFEEIVDYARETVFNGRPLSKDPLIRQKLAQMAIELEVSKLLYYQLAYILDREKIPNYQASMEKMFATEVAQRICNTGMEVLGLYGQLKKGDPRAPLAGKLEFFYRSSVVETIYAGTSEIQRNIIAERGLGLPRG
ncbi:MAG: acyl-CoA dehydrogenase family protein [Desulfobacteraceae bacterium]|nr:acyl-CoA dehydrogenase family protein [Desulfobacteraceae bacterium]